MWTLAQLKARMRRGEVRGRLLISADGTEWLRVGLRSAEQLKYYLSRVTIYGFVPD